MSTTSVSQHPGYFFSLCTGHALFLPFKPLGELLSEGFVIVSQYTCWIVSLHVSYKMTVKLFLQSVAIQFSVVNVIFLFYSGQDNDINLMKACWNELFALGLAQCSSVMNVGTILSAIISHLQTSLQEGKRAQLLDTRKFLTLD